MYSTPGISNRELFHGAGHTLLDLFGRSAGHGHEDVEHGNDDLRLLFSRQHQEGEEPQQHRTQQETEGSAWN